MIEPVEPIDPITLLAYETAVRTAVEGGEIDVAIELLTSSPFVAKFLRVLGSRAVFDLLSQYLRLSQLCPDRCTATVRAFHSFLRGNADRIARGGHVAFLQLAAMAEVDDAVRSKAQKWLSDGRAGSSWLRHVAQTTPADGSLQTFEWGTAPVRALAFSRDGATVMAVDASGRLGAWPLTGHRQMLPTATGDTNTSAICATPDGRYALTGSQEGVVRAIRIGDKCELFFVDAHTQAVTAIVILHDDLHAASVSTDGSIAVWRFVDKSRVDGSLVDERLTLRLTPANGAPRALHGAALAADPGCLLVAASDGQLEVWDLRAGARIRSVAAGVGALSAVVPIPGARDVLVVGATGVARVDPDARTARLQEGELGLARGRTSLVIHPDARHAFHSRTRGVEVFDLDTGARQTAFLDDRVVVDGFALSPNGARLLTWYEEAGTIKLWDTTAPPQFVAEPRGHPRPVTTVCVDWRNERVYSSSPDGDVRTWDVVTGTTLGEPLAHSSAQYAVHHDATSGRLVMVGQDGKVSVYDATRALISTFELSQYGDPRSVLLVGGRRLVTGGGTVVDAISGSKPSNMHSLEVLELPTGKVMMRLNGHTDEITAIAAHPDPARIVSASFDRELRFWNLDDGHCTCIPLKESVPRSMAVHPDGDRVFIGGMVLSVWSLSQGCFMRTIGETGALIETVACCPSGERVLTLRRDRTACLWDLRTGEQVARWDGEDPFATGAFGPAGRVILGDDAGTVTFLEFTRASPVL